MNAQITAVSYKPAGVTTATTKKSEMKAQVKALAADKTAINAILRLSEPSAVELLAVSQYYAAVGADNQATAFRLLHKIILTDEIIKTLKPRMGPNISGDRNIGIVHTSVLLEAMQDLRVTQREEYRKFQIMAAPEGDEEL